MNIVKELRIKIGECIFRIKAKGDYKFPVSEEIKGFVINDGDDFDIDVTVMEGKPKFNKIYKKLTEARDLIEVVDGEIVSHYYTLNKSQDEFFVKSGQEDGKAPVKYLISDTSYQNWKVYVAEDKNGCLLDPLRFPVGPIIYYYGLSSKKNLLLHASGIHFNDKGFVFTGMSGVGKTTISRLWIDSGGEIINDDRLIIDVNTNNGIAMYNSPMAYPQENNSSPLHAAFLLKQAKTNYLKQLPKSLAYAKLTSLCIQHDHDKILINNMMESLQVLINKIPVYELGFLPHKSAVECVLRHFNME